MIQGGESLFLKSKVAFQVHELLIRILKVAFHGLELLFLVYGAWICFDFTDDHLNVWDLF